MLFFIWLTSSRIYFFPPISLQFERKLLVAGFLDVQIFPVKPVSQSEALDSLGVSFPSHSFLFLGPGETDTNKFLNA